MKAKRQAGISLIELMVAMLVGLILVGGMISLFIEVRGNLSRTDKVSTLTTEGQYAMTILSHDLASAGFWGKTFEPQNIGLDPTVFDPSSAANVVSPDCGPEITLANGDKLAWAMNLTRPLEHYDDADGAHNNEFTCLGSEVADGTDIIALRRVAGSAIEDPATSPDTKHTDNRVYLRSVSGDGGMYRHRNGTPPTLTKIVNFDPTTIQDWAYVPTVYFIRKYSRQNGDGIPTLCRKAFNSGTPPGFAAECFAEGIEDLQFEFGIDQNADGAADYYDSAPIDAELNLVTTVRIFLLSRSLSPHGGQLDISTYALGGKTYQPNDNYFRELYTATVPIRNPKRLRAIQ